MTSHIAGKTGIRQLVLASNNQGKLLEFQALFAAADLAIEVIPQSQFGVADAIEDGLSFVENALIKARHASRCTGLAAVADDSGLCVPILGGAPGIYSARYAQDEPDFADNKDKANNQKLLRHLAPLRKQVELGETGNSAIIGQFVCVLALVRSADDPLPIIAQGIWQGEILDEPLGDAGFGYDPLFWLAEHNMSAAQMSKSQKNTISHRGMAMRQLIAQLQIALL